MKLSWIKPSRLLLWGFYVFLLGICIIQWALFIVQSPTRFETIAWDFLNLYTGAHIVAHGQGEHVYNVDNQIRYQETLLGTRQVSSGVLPFLYPPTILPLLLPLGLLPLATGYYVWLALSVVLLAVYLFLLHRYLWDGTRSWGTYVLAVASFFPLSVHLMQGQTTLLVLLGLTGAYVLFLHGREFWAGLSLALCSVKPPLAMPILLVVLGKRRWAALAGFGVGVCLLLLPTVPLLGLSGYEEYIGISLSSLGWRGQYGIFPTAMHNWRAFALRLLGPGLGADLLLAGLELVSLGALACAWRGAWRPAGPRFPLQFAATLVLTTLISPHLYVHDLVLWLLAGALIAYASPVLQEPRSSWLWYGLLLLGSAVPLWIMLDPGPGGPLTLLPAVAAAGALVARLSRPAGTSHLKPLTFT